MGGSDSLRLEQGRLVHGAPLGSNSWPFPVLSGTAVFCGIAQLSPHFLVMCYMYVSPGFNSSCVFYASSLKKLHTCGLKALLSRDIYRIGPGCLQCCKPTLLWGIQLSRGPGTKAHTNPYGHLDMLLRPKPVAVLNAPL